jgi:hypothetical protein
MPVALLSSQPRVTSIYKIPLHVVAKIPGMPVLKLFGKRMPGFLEPANDVTYSVAVEDAIQFL